MRVPKFPDAGLFGIKCDAIAAIIILLILFACGQNHPTKPGYTIEGSIAYNHHFYFGPEGLPMACSATLNTDGSIPFQIYISPGGPDTFVANGNTRHHISEFCYDEYDECMINGYGDNDVNLRGTLIRNAAEPESIVIYFDETWYSSGGWSVECRESGHFRGEYQVEHHQFSATFALRDSCVVELDSTMNADLFYRRDGNGVYRWILHIDGADSVSGNNRD